MQTPQSPPRTDLTEPMHAQTPKTQALTPSKRSAASEGQDLCQLLSICKEVLCDPNLASPCRRVLHKATHTALSEAVKKAEAIRRGELHVMKHQRTFESKVGHGYKPTYSPARRKSASERCSTYKARQKARLAAQLTVGQGEMPVSEFQKAQNDRRKQHSLQDRRKRIQQTVDSKPTGASSSKPVD
jgi:hypothetical protein